MAEVNDEVVRLKLAGDEVPIASQYEVSSGVLKVPATFSMTVGHPGIFAELAAAYPPYTPFELFVGDVRIQQGETDANDTAGGLGTEMRIRGRDMVKRLTDTMIRSERTFSEKSFRQLTEVALQEVGLGDRTIISDNQANRKAITGVQTIKQLAPPSSEEAVSEVSADTATTRTVYRTLNAEIGTTWWSFLAEQYRRAGLFLWAAVDGSFVLSQPNGATAPITRIIRRRKRRNGPGDVTVIGQPTFTHDATKRYTECEVMGRAGGGKNGRGRVSGRHFDDEMIALLNQDEADRADGGTQQKPLIIHDDKVQTKQEAEFLARRKIAESRRNGWRLSYTVAGHTAPAVGGGGRVIWQPDIVVEVVDDELGLEGAMYVESVIYRRAPHTTTQVNLMRPDHLVFAEEDIELVNKRALRKPKERMGVTTVEHLREDTHSMWEKNPNWGGLPTSRVRTGSTTVERVGSG